MYEYKVLTSTEMEDDEETALNRLGSEGFELVSVTVSQMTYVETSEDEDDEGEEYTEDVVTYYFKKQK
ncbi:MAG: DUF4177 domain-containing protein [Armatimonadetes bacterium]|nr:DUF4177 domain-containing protein [Armatimonadota bacterium]